MSPKQTTKRINSEVNICSKVPFDDHYEKNIKIILNFNMYHFMY